MATHLDPSTYNLGLAFCFILVAYIFYSLGLYIQLHNTSIPVQDESEQNQPAVPNRGYEKGFADGMKACQAFDVHDVHRLKADSMRKSEDVKKREKDLEMRMAKIDVAMKDIEGWSEQRKAQIKGSTEGRVRLIWERKQKAEKGRGWLTFGGGRKVKKIEAHDEKLSGGQKSG